MIKTNLKRGDTYEASDGVVGDVVKVVFGYDYISKEHVDQLVIDWPDVGRKVTAAWWLEDEYIETRIKVE